MVTPKIKWGGFNLAGQTYLQATFTSRCEYLQRVAEAEAREHIYQVEAAITGDLDHAFKACMGKVWVITGATTNHTSNWRNEESKVRVTFQTDSTDEEILTQLNKLYGNKEG